MIFLNEVCFQKLFSLTSLNPLLFLILILQGNL